MNVHLFYSLTPYIHTFVILRIQEMQTTHIYININFVILFIISFVKNFIRLIYILFNNCTCNFTLTFAFLDYFNA